MSVQSPVFKEKRKKSSAVYLCTDLIKCCIFRCKLWKQTAQKYLFTLSATNSSIEYSNPKKKSQEFNGQWVKIINLLNKEYAFQWHFFENGNR